METSSALDYDVVSPIITRMQYVVFRTGTCLRDVAIIVLGTYALQMYMIICEKPTMIQCTDSCWHSSSRQIMIDQI
jgi:hypothetical protein